jgi:hypothetical protein
VVVERIDLLQGNSGGERRRRVKRAIHFSISELESGDGSLFKL